MQDRPALLETSLERAAEALGDITRPVMARFYRSCPQARAAFERHGLGKRERLEAEMVETSLYCAMRWVEDPAEISITLSGSVPHHQETLDVSLSWYRSLLETVIDVIAETIPADRPDELELWRQIRRELGQAIETSQSRRVRQASAAA